MSDLRRPSPSRTRLAASLRAHTATFAALFAGADGLAAELAELLADPEAEPFEAAVHGAQLARAEGDLEALARDFAALRVAVTSRLADAGEPADADALRAMHEGLDRQFGACAAAFLREREAQWMSMVAHDINNPLMSIFLCRDYFAGSLEGSSEQVAVRDMLLHASEQLQELTRGLQDVVDLRDNPAMLGREPIAAAELIEEAVAWQTTAAAGRGVRLETSTPGEPVLVLGDRERLSWALAAVLRRAIRATGARRTVALHGSVEAGELVLRVREGGADVVVSTSGRRRADTEMFVTRNLVEAHGGRMWTEPAGPGSATTIALTLPLAPEE